VLDFDGLLHTPPPRPVLGVGLLCNQMMHRLAGGHPAMLNLSPLPTCSICNKPVKLETSKVDELGKAVHEGCYLLKVSVKKAPIVPKHLATHC